MLSLDFIEANIISFVLGFFVNYSYDKYKRKKLESNSFCLSSIQIRSNFFESYFTDQPIKVSCEISNQSPFHWHDLRIDVYSSIFINESPVDWSTDDADDPFFKRLSIEIPFIKSKDQHSVEIPYSPAIMQSIQNKIIANDITVADGLFNPLKFISLLNNPETLVKMKIGSKASDQYFPLCLHETFFKSQLLLTLHNTFDNPVARYGGVIDYLVITGKSRVARRDVEFLKIVPIANIWLSTKEGQLRYSHDLLFVNTCFNVDVDFEVRNKTLQPLASQTYVKHSKPEAEKLKILLGKKKLNFEYGTLTLGDDVNNIECSIAIIVSDTPKMYKNVLTASLGQEITTPEIRVSR